MNLQIVSFKNAFTESAGINNSMLLKARESVDKALLEKDT